MPRKTRGDPIAIRWWTSPASMRPRPDAAENGRPDVGFRQARLASMRPRPDAAENVAGEEGRIARRRDASMRPRPDAAENIGEEITKVDAEDKLQMRPRPDAAENSRGRARTKRGCRLQ